MSLSPIAQKLRIKPGYRIAVVAAPPGYLDLLDPLPEGATVSESLDGTFDLIWYFAPRRAELDRDIMAIRAAAGPAAPIWLSYPKGTSGVATDLKREVMWDAAKPAGLQAVSQIAVDDIWSALRFKIVT